MDGPAHETRRANTEVRPDCSAGGEQGTRTQSLAPPLKPTCRSWDRLRSFSPDDSKRNPKRTCGQPPGKGGSAVSPPSASHHRVPLLPESKPAVRTAPPYGESRQARQRSPLPQTVPGRRYVSRSCHCFARTLQEGQVPLHTWGPSMNPRMATTVSARGDTVCVQNVSTGSGIRLDARARKTVVRVAELDSFVRAPTITPCG